VCHLLHSLIAHDWHFPSYTTAQGEPLNNQWPQWFRQTYSTIGNGCPMRVCTVFSRHTKGKRKLQQTFYFLPHSLKRRLSMFWRVQNSKSLDPAHGKYCSTSMIHCLWLIPFFGCHSTVAVACILVVSKWRAGNSRKFYVRIETNCYIKAISIQIYIQISVSDPDPHSMAAWISISRRPKKGYKRKGKAYPMGRYI
jgi:hypothetical protein